MTIKWIFKLTILIFISSLLSCSNSDKKTPVQLKINLGKMVSALTSSGGAVLYGKNERGDFFGRIVNTESSSEFSLPNGQWKFWLFSWSGDGQSNNFTGESYCGVGGAQLNGTNTEVVINVSNSLCGSNEFSEVKEVDGNGKIRFPTLALDECIAKDANGITPIHCRPGNFGGALSYKVFFQNFEFKNGEQVRYLPEMVGSSCISHTSARSGSHNIRLPYLPAGTPGLLKIKFFYTDDQCNDGSKGEKLINLGFGGIKGDPVEFSRAVSEGTCNVLTLSESNCSSVAGVFSGSCLLNTFFQDFISSQMCADKGGVFNAAPTKKFKLTFYRSEEETCSGPRIIIENLTPHAFAGGDGTEFRPHQLCTPHQLHQVSKDNTSLTKHFRVMRDLDLNFTSKIGGYPDSYRACLGEDYTDTFEPIGGMFTGVCKASSNKFAGDVSFVGVFDGGGHTISNLRTSFKTASGVGMFRKIVSPAIVRNFTLVNSDVIGDNGVGTIAGFSNGGIVENVVIKNSKIYAKAGNNGGIIGSDSDSNFLKFKNVHVKNAKFKIVDGNLGGLLGFSNSSTGIELTNSSFEGHLDSSKSINSVFIGGLVGNTIAPTTITSSYAKFTLDASSNSTKVGGAIGTLNNSLSLDNFYVLTGMNFDRKCNGTLDLIIGGLIGHNLSSASGTANNFYTQNKIYSVCSGFSDINTNYGKNNSGFPIISKGYGYVDFINGSNDSLTSTSNSAENISTTELSPTLFSAGHTFVRTNNTSRPRLSTEINEHCLSATDNAVVSDQINNFGRGTDANPIVLCGKQQFQDLITYPTKSFIVEDMILFDHNSAFDSSNQIQNFTGKLNGNKYPLVGVDITSPSMILPSLFRDIEATGVLKNLNFYLGSFQADGASANAAFLAQTNHGKIEDSVFHKIYLKSTHDSIKLSGLLGTNNGLLGKIKNIKTDMEIAGCANISGLARINNGVIKQVFLKNYLGFAFSTSACDASAVSYENDGTIEEVVSESTLLNGTISNSPFLLNTNSTSKLNGFVYRNKPGRLILNSKVSPASLLKTLDNSSVNIYGFAYLNEGDIKNTIAAGKILHFPSGFSIYSDPSKLNNGVKNNSGGSSENFYFHENSAVSLHKPSALTIGSCSPGGGNLTLNFSSTLDGSFISTFTNPRIFVVNGEDFSKSYGVSNNAVANSASNNLVPQYLTLYPSCDTFENGFNIYHAHLYSGVVNSVLGTGKTPNSFAELEVFCPDAGSSLTDQDFSCGNNTSINFDIAAAPSTSSVVSGLNRILSYFKNVLFGTPIPANSPVWSIEDGRDYPKLINVETDD